MKLLIIFSLFGLAAAGVFQHELIRVESRKSKMKREGTWESSYTKTKQFSKSSTNYKSISQVLNDYRDYLYLANVTIGTPEQQFLVDLDTGSSDFWIPDSSCGSSKKNIKGGKVCYGKHLFFSNESSTYIKNGKPWRIDYEQGYAGGFLGFDIVGLGGIGEKQLVIPNTGIGQATIIDSQAGEDAYFNGIMGLGFPSGDSAGVNPVLFNAMKQGLLDKPIFTIYLQECGNQVDVPAGSITYGGFDNKHCSKKVNYVPLTSEFDYRFKLNSLTFGNYSFSIGWQVISDSGTTYITVPSFIYKEITKGMDIQANGTIDCDAKLDDLKLKIGRKEYIVQGKQLILHEKNGKCTFAIYSLDMNESLDMILGDPWIRSYCNVYHLKEKKIGFAEIIG